MKEIFFYNIESRDFLKDISLLIEKLFRQGIKVLIFCPDDSIARLLDDFLWTFKEESFIPHIVVDKNYNHLETIIISKDKLNVESFKTLIVFKGSSVDSAFCNKFEKTYYFFDDNNADEKKLARNVWREALRLGIKCNYWRVENNRWKLVGAG